MARTKTTKLYVFDVTEGAGLGLTIRALGTNQSEARKRGKALAEALVAQDRDFLPESSDATAWDGAIRHLLFGNAQGEEVTLWFTPKDLRLSDLTKSDVETPFGDDLPEPE